MMESIEKLRELCAKWRKTSITPGRNSAADEVDKIADEIESEIAERYMPRPCDMDGVPIEIGDELSHDGFARNFIVHSYELVDGTWAVWDVANGATHICSACRHVKQRTVEDVLRELVNDAEWEQSPDSYEEIERRLITLYTAELRGLLGGDGR